MAHVFQVESACSSWLQEKWACCDTAGIRDAALLAHQHHHQKTIHHSFSSKGALQQQFHHRVFCSTSNADSESQARKQISSSSRSSRSPRRPARASKSDAELRRDLQLFLSSRGLPPDKVPSIKELSNCGREGLAKIVRRRGYKAIHTLLTDSDTGTSITQESNPVSNVKDIATGDNVNDASKVTSDPASHTQKAEQSLNGIARPLKSGISYDSGQVIGSSSLIQKPADLKEDGSLETAPKTSYFLNGSLIDKQADEQLHKRAADFVKMGQLYNVQDSDEDEEEEDNFYEDSSDEDDSGEIWDGHKSAEAIAVEKAAKLQAKLLPLFKSDVAGKLNNQTDESILSILQEQKGAEEFQFCKENTQMGLAFTVEAEVELQNIKSALSSKERELIETSRELEETKAQLALIQAKATAEVAQAKQAALEKDIRLKSADQVLTNLKQVLTNLKQVQVEYWGEGGRVELAGSFNGWEYFIFMEPDPTSEISTPDGSRGPLMWETKLWLYPGIYEIKFIVDGHWQIDQRREVVMRNSLHNNILRVEP